MASASPASLMFGAAAGAVVPAGAAAPPDAAVVAPAAPPAVVDSTVAGATGLASADGEAVDTGSGPPASASAGTA